jgi:uncharacterized protein YwqG
LTARRRSGEVPILSIVALFRRRRDVVVVAEPSPPRPMTRDEVAQRLLISVDSLRPAVRYATRREPDAGIDIAQSKLGGAPDLPRGTRWPMVTTQGEPRPLQFFAQLDLAEASATAPSPLGLPADGQLSFFADFDSSGRPTADPESPTILYSPSDSQFARCSLRLVPLPTAQLAPVGVWSWSGVKKGADSEAFNQEYEAEVRHRAPERYQFTGRHQLGGHSESEDKFGDDEVALFQLDSDDTVEIAWGAEGSSSRLVWVLRSADLARSDWGASRLIVLGG